MALMGLQAACPQPKTSTPIVSIRSILTCCAVDHHSPQLGLVYRNSLNANDKNERAHSPSSLASHNGF